MGYDIGWHVEQPQRPGVTLRRRLRVALAHLIVFTITTALLTGWIMASAPRTPLLWAALPSALGMAMLWVFGFAIRWAGDVLAGDR